MGALDTARRYYLGAARTQAIGGEVDLSWEALHLRNSVSLTPFPPGFPLAAKLSAVLSPELEAVGIAAPVYEGLEDLQGADAEELLEAGLTQQEAAAVLAALAA